MGCTVNPVERLSVHVLGAFEVVGLDERGIGSRKARSLLKLLACSRGASVSVDRITQALWGDELPAKPADQVSVLVSRLRAVLGGRIPRSDAGYALRYDWLDLDEMIARSEEASARLRSGRPGAARAAATAALRLVGGRPLPDEDSEWADVARTQIERVVATTRHAGAEAALAVGAPGEAAALASAALDLDPYDETALQFAMRALARTGRPGSALAVYTAFKSRLVDEFGVDPTSETERVHDDIVLGKDTAFPAVGDGASSRAALVGRDAELDALDTRLADARRASQFVIIEGEPGIGKSALVQEWAARIARGGTTVLLGRCDQVGIGLPLQPVLDAVKAWLDSARGPLDSVGGDGSAGDGSAGDGSVGGDRVLGPLLGIGDAARSGSGALSTTTVEESEFGRLRIFTALSELIDRRRAGSPMVMIIEDVHHADPGTLAWLNFFVRSLAGVMAVATSRPRGVDVERANMLALGPIDVTAAAQLVGDLEVGLLHARSGGNPLFLMELAQVADGELPASIVAAVRRRGDALGPAASTLRVAALLGSEIDLDLLSACCRRPVGEVLDHIEIAVAHELLSDLPDGLRFRHDVVREALVAGTTVAVRAFVHREASILLAARADRSPLDTAHHAERAGAADVASAAFVEGAAIAAHRYAADLAEELLDRAIELSDSYRARLERARVRLTRRNLDGAASDADIALAIDRTPTALELAGWIAYYRRDYPTALLLAEEVRESATDEAVQAGAAVLEGRIRHARGDLVGAVSALQTVTRDIGSHRLRGIPAVWLAAALVHQGNVGEALSYLEDARDSPDLQEHPFAVGHAWFARCLANGIAGRLAAASAAVAGLQAHADGSGVAGHRFRPMAANFRSWLERSVGDLAAAEKSSLEALDLAGHASFEEPAVHARLDLVEIYLGGGREADANEMLGVAAAHLESTCTMAWHLNQRLLWLSGRLALRAGDAAGAGACAAELASDAGARASQRYLVLADHLSVLVASRGPGNRHAVSDGDAAIERMLAGLDHLAGLDSWWLVAEWAAATGNDRLWQAARARAASLLARSRAVAADPFAVEKWLGASIELIRLR